MKRAYAVYSWVVENTFRDEGVKEGCGLGLPIRTLQDLKGGGKCADISAVFVTLARAAGIPARDVYGLRIAAPKTGEITGNYHCWAEFYLPGTGWVPADPADVRKAILVKSAAELTVDVVDVPRDRSTGGQDHDENADEYVAQDAAAVDLATLSDVAVSRESTVT